MIERDIHIRDWDIVFHFSFDKYDKWRILDALLWADAPNSIISQVSENVGSGRFNEGFCFSNPSERKTVLAIGKTTTGPEFLDTTIHEITHITQDIAHTDNIDPFGEDFAYLSGDISHEISDIVCKMSCPHCRCE